MIIVPNIAGKKDPVTFVSSNGQAGASANTLTTPHIAGDLLVAFVTNYGGGDISTFPTGWTSASGFTSSANGGALWKIATSTDDQLGNLGFSSDAIIAAFRGTSTPTVGTSSSVNGSGVSGVAPAITVTGQLTSMIVHYVGYRDNNGGIGGLPAGYTQRFGVRNGSSGAGFSLATKNDPTSDGAVQVINTGYAGGFVGISMEILA